MYREACRDTQTSILPARHLVREPNARSGGHEFQSPMLWELVALTKVERSVYRLPKFTWDSEQCSTNKVPLSSDKQEVEFFLRIREPWRLVNEKQRVARKC